jgi:hypothetical protein
MSTNEDPEREEVKRLEIKRDKIIESPDNERFLAWTVGIFLLVASLFVLFTGWYAGQLDELINVKASQLSSQIAACGK